MAHRRVLGDQIGLLAGLLLEAARDAWGRPRPAGAGGRGAFNDIQTRPRYPSGLAPRFARVKRWREDKRPDEADTMETVRAIHAAAIGVHSART